jgi:serine/threonine protein kinase
LPWREALEICECVASALEAVHGAGAIHRDLKSENVMLVGPERVPKLMDFGLAHWSDLSALTGSHALLGTLPYMSPEQVAGHDAEPSWDLWALGVVLHEMLCGVVPFSEDTAIRLMKRITNEPYKPIAEHGVSAPPAVESLLARLLAKAVGERIATAAELRAVINQVLATTK